MNKMYSEDTEAHVDATENSMSVVAGNSINSNAGLGGNSASSCEEKEAECISVKESNSEVVNCDSPTDTDIVFNVNDHVEHDHLTPAPLPLSSTSNLSDSGVETDTYKNESSTEPSPTTSASSTVHLSNTNSLQIEEYITSECNSDKSELTESGNSLNLLAMYSGQQPLEIATTLSEGEQHTDTQLSSVFNHPAYKMMVQELVIHRDENSLLKSNIELLESRVQELKLESDKLHNSSTLQLETLDKTIRQQEKEILKLTELDLQQTESASKNYTQLKDELESKLEKMTKLYEAANKDRESAVMRYAMGEKAVIDQMKERDSLDKRLKEANKEKELLVSKLKLLTTDKSRVCQILDTKCNDLQTLQKECEKLKEDLNSRDIKVKWTQNKLRTEVEIHKETQMKVEKLSKKLEDTREEAEQVRRDCQSMMRTFQTSEENKAYTLDQLLKEQQAQLIMERHEFQDKEETHRQLVQESEALKKKHQLILNENNLLSVKVQNLEIERLEYEQNLSKLKRTCDDQQQNIADLHSKLAEMESLRLQLQHEHEKLSASQSEVERLRLSSAELQQDMTACREKEAELLEFTQKLTDKNVRLQSEFSATEAKAQELEFELGPRIRMISELESRVSVLSQQLDQEKQLRQEENQLLARHLAEKTQRVDVLTQQFEDQLGENQVLKRKQAASIKEMLRELNQARKRLEMYETNGSGALDQVSRASSNSSLNTLEVGSSVHSYNSRHRSQPSPPLKAEVEANGSLEPDRQVLIEHIVKLQRANARKDEKLEFMDEHAQQLVAELQKKTRILQSYILREQSGALSSEAMDQNKTETLRHVGIMSSVYGSKSVDSSMTLELALEIMQKLQSVLEDTLLKNITLKDSIETLGDEISRLQNKCSKS